jgi:hypothetical protein
VFDDAPDLPLERAEQIRLMSLRHLSWQDQALAFTAQCHPILDSPPISVADLDEINRRLAAIEAQAIVFLEEQRAIAQELGTEFDDGTLSD